MKFIITGLPRSRTAWFAAYLSTGNTFCYHEAVGNRIKMDAPHENVGNSEAWCYDWDEIMGEHKKVIIHRDPEEVKKSLATIGITGLDYEVDHQASLLTDLKGLHVDFDNIDLMKIHKYLKLPYDPYRADLFTRVNIQAEDWRNR